MSYKIKQKIKLFIFIIESLFIIGIICTMAFTRIHNGSLFSVFHINDKSEHLIIKDMSVSIYEIGEPVFYEKSVIMIRSSKMDTSIWLSIDNNGKRLTDENIIVAWDGNSPYITISAENQETITYGLQ